VTWVYVVSQQSSCNKQIKSVYCWHQSVDLSITISVLLNDVTVSVWTSWSFTCMCKNDGCSRQWKKYVDMYVCFDTCDRQTDRQTDRQIPYQYRASWCRRAIKISKVIATSGFLLAIEWTTYVFWPMVHPNHVGGSVQRAPDPPPIRLGTNAPSPITFPLRRLQYVGAFISTSGVPALILFYTSSIVSAVNMRSLLEHPTPRFA